MWDSAVITNAGKSLLAEWIAGKCLNFDGAATGEGTVQETYLMAQTALAAQKQALSIIKMDRIDGGIRLQLQCTNEAVSEEYKINQIGVWASLDGGASTLVAIFQDATGVSVPTHEDMPDYVFTFYAVLQMSNESILRDGLRCRPRNWEKGFAPFNRTRRGYPPQHHGKGDRGSTPRPVATAANAASSFSFFTYIAKREDA